jgi:predicted DNA-binding transcriptional regulator YafY
LLPDADSPDKLISVHIRGKEQAINELCLHWLFGHIIEERTATEVHFKIDEQALRTYALYFLIVYGRSIEVLEPPLLKERLVEVASELLDYYTG